MRTKKMALLLLIILLSLHLHASSYPSQNLLVSAFNDYKDQNNGERRSGGLDVVNTSMKVASGEATVVDKRGGGGGGGGGGGHGGAAGGHGGGGARSAGGANGDTAGEGANRGYGAVVPLFAAGTGAHHAANNRHHGKNDGTTTSTCVGLPLLAFGVFISLLVAQPYFI